MYLTYLPVLIYIYTSITSTHCEPELPAGLKMNVYPGRRDCKGSGFSYDMAYGFNITQTATSCWISRDIKKEEALDWFAGGQKYPMEKHMGCHSLNPPMGAFHLWVP